jgi:peptidoglycan/LPS O-acetylase OafA/YrhL
MSLALASASTVKRSGTLDVVRGVAIVAVIAVHSFQSAVAIAPEGSISIDSKLFVGFSYLRFSVELFFALSGWLMFSLYRRNESATSKSYWARRILRIWPLWILFTVITFVISFTTLNYLVPFTGSSYSVLEIISSFLLCIFFLGWFSATFWNVPFGGWSIQVEIGHYLVFWFVRNRSIRFILFTILAGYLTYFTAQYFFENTSSGFIHDLSESWIRFGLFGTWPFFIAGGLAYLAHASIRQSGFKNITENLGKRWDLVVLVGLIMILAFSVPIPQGQSKEAAVAVLVLLLVSWPITKVLRLSLIFQSWGRYSYFMYFMHFWILHFAVNAAVSRGWNVSFLSGGLLVLFYFIALASLAILISWAIAIPSWKLFESKFLVLAKKFR